jgi:SAM-dependent methyltransferase
MNKQELLRKNTAKLFAAQTVYDSGRNPAIMGDWDPLAMLSILGAERGFWENKSVLDIGGNTGGLSLEIARLGANVTIAEPDPYKNNMALSRDFLLSCIDKEKLKLDIQQHELFNCHELGYFDVVLCLGLIYHFRYPQYLIDYLSSMKPGILFISCQTHPGDELKLVNRAQPGVLPSGFLPESTVLTGWHPTKPLFERMLKWAGFINVTLLTDSSVNFPQKPRHGTTNSTYYRAEGHTIVDPELERRKFYPR